MQLIKQFVTYSTHKLKAAGNYFRATSKKKQQKTDHNKRF